MHVIVVSALAGVVAFVTRRLPSRISSHLAATRIDQADHKDIVLGFVIVIAAVVLSRVFDIGQAMTSLVWLFKVMHGLQ